jgi:hypothetical protein
MNSEFVILTGSSGSGKTAIARTIEASHPEIAVFQFDTIGIPIPEIMATYGNGYQPGGAWQRAMTLEWLERVAPVLKSGRPVLFEGQMRVAFVREALDAQSITGARIICVECDDATRAGRVTNVRLQPELASESMVSWSRYLHEETIAAGYEILDTTALTLTQSVQHVLAALIPIEPQ